MAVEVEVVKSGVLLIDTHQYSIHCIMLSAPSLGSQPLAPYLSLNSQSPVTIVSGH